MKENLDEAEKENEKFLGPLIKCDYCFSLPIYVFNLFSDYFTNSKLSYMRI